MKQIIFVIFLLSFSTNISASQYYWENGSRQGSRYYWLNGTGPNSQYYWENGSRQGSRYYWLNATKKSFYNPISICTGLGENNSEIPPFCEGYR